MMTTVPSKHRKTFYKGAVFDYYGSPVTVFRVNRETVCVTSPIESKPFAVSKILLMELNGMKCNATKNKNGTRR